MRAGRADADLSHVCLDVGLREGRTSTQTEPLPCLTLDRHSTAWTFADKFLPSAFKHGVVD